MDRITLSALIAALATVGSTALNKYGGNKDKQKNLNNFTPEQKGLQNDIISQIRNSSQPGGNYAQSQDYFNRILSGDPQAYNQFAAPYIQKFNTQTIPRLAEQFGALGGASGGGIPGSSGFGQAIGGASADFESQLAGLFANLQQNAATQGQNQYNNLSSTALGRQAFIPGYQPGNVGPLSNVLGGIAEGAGKNFGMYAGNRFGSNNEKATGTDPFSPNDYSAISNARNMHMLNNPT